MIYLVSWKSSRICRPTQPSICFVMLFHRYQYHTTTHYRQPSTINRLQRNAWLIPNHTRQSNTPLKIPTSPINSTPQRYRSLEVNNTPSYQDTTHNTMEPTSYPYATLHAEATVDCNILWFMNINCSRTCQKKGYWYQALVNLYKSSNFMLPNIANEILYTMHIV